MPGMLTDRDRAVLEFERRPWRYQGAKDEAILTLFGMTAIRYAQVLASVLANPEAEEWDPAHVRRLRRLHAARRNPYRSRRRGYGD